MDAEFLQRLHFILEEPVDFALTDPETTQTKVQLLVAAATYFNVMAVTDFGGQLGPVRAEGLVEQVVGAAFQTYGGEDPYADPFLRAAMLLRGITLGHPFNDGNKRTGFLVAAYYLDAVGYPLPDALRPDEAVELCMEVSAGRIRDVQPISVRLRKLWRRGT